MSKTARDWDQHYLDNHTPWDKGEPSPALMEVIASGELPRESEVFVPGCGLGHDVVPLAKADCSVTGLDISPSAVERAKSVNGMKGVHFALSDFLDPADPFLKQSEPCDVIWEHTCFCAISPERRDSYVEACHRCLKPGGFLFGVFFAFADEPDSDGPPFKTDVQTIHRHFESRFTLEWERRPERSFSSRQGQEWLMCWKKKL